MAEVSPELLVDAMFSYQKTAALIAALDLGIFTAIGEGAATAAVLAERAGAAERGVRILADYLTVHGFLTKAAGHYAPTPASAVFLDQRSPTYMGSAIEFL